MRYPESQLRAPDQVEKHCIPGAPMVFEVLAAVAVAFYDTDSSGGAGRGVSRRDDDLVAVETWLEQFSPGSYLPMVRLAEGRDTPFLRKFRGVEETARYRRLQRQMLRDYLHSLARDFHRLHGLGAEETPNSALIVVEERMAFSLGIWSIELRLLVNEVAPCA